MALRTLWLSPPTWWRPESFVFTGPVEHLLFRAAGGCSVLVWDIDHEVAGPSTCGARCHLPGLARVEHTGGGRKGLPWHLTGYVNGQQTLGCRLIEWARVCVCVCMHMCACVCVHTHTHTHTHLQRHIPHPGRHYSTSPGLAWSAPSCRGSGLSLDCLDKLPIMGGTLIHFHKGGF